GRPGSYATSSRVAGGRTSGGDWTTRARTTSEGSAMGEYVGLPGVRTWYETEGSGEPLVLLHGGFCTNETWGAQRADLAAAHRLFLPERRGHGHTPDVPGPLTYRDMADDTVSF